MSLSTGNNPADMPSTRPSKSLIFRCARGDRTMPHQSPNFILIGIDGTISTASLMFSVAASAVISGTLTSHSRPAIFSCHRGSCRRRAAVKEINRSSRLLLESRPSARMHFAGVVEEAFAPILKRSLHFQYRQYPSFEFCRRARYRRH